MTITGTKKVKSSDLMNFFSNYFKIRKNNIKYLKNEGHYDNKPTPYEPRKGKNFYIKNAENFDKNVFLILSNLFRANPQLNRSNMKGIKP